MGRGKWDAHASGSSDGEVGGDGGRASGYATLDCGLCHHPVAVDKEEHIAGECTKCNRIPLHTPCVQEYLERVLKKEFKDGGYTTKERNSVLLLAGQRPTELIGVGGRPPKWKSLRSCCVCQDGTMETAEVVKKKKAAPAAPAAAAPRVPRPAPKAPRAPASRAPRQQPAVPVARRAGPVDSGPSPAARMHGSGSANTFAAEQERAAKEAQAKAREERRAAREAERAAQRAQQHQEQLAALTDGWEVPSDSEGGGASSGWATPATEPAWPPGSDAARPVSGSSLGVPTPQLSHQGSLAPDAGLLHSSSFASAAGGWGEAKAPDAAWYAFEAAPAPAGQPAASDNHWIAPEFERAPAPDEEVDEYLAMLGLGG